MRGNNSVFLDDSKVRAAFRASGKTKEDLVKELGRSRGFINSAMNNNFCTKNKFSINSVAKLAQALNALPNDIIADRVPEATPEGKKPILNWAGILMDWMGYKGMSSNEVARRSGMVPEHLRRIRRGEILNLRGATVDKLAEAFGVKREELLAGPPKKVKPETKQESQQDLFAPGEMLLQHGGKWYRVTGWEEVKEAE